MCKVKLRYNEKENIYKFFVAHNGSKAVLGMLDIGRLGMLSINLNSKNRQVAVAEEDNENNCQSQRQTKSDKWEQLKGELQETETQNTQDANDNPMVMGNNNKESIASLSEVLISQKLIADAERKDDMATVDIQTNYNSIDPFSEALNNQNLITGAETKEDETTMGMQINCNSIDFLAESHIQHSSCIIEEEEDDMTAIGIQIDCNSVDFIEDSLISCNSPIFEEETKDTAAQNTTTNNNIESLIVGISTDGNQAQTTQNKNRKQNKNKKI